MKNGFTLVELLLTISIISILTGLTLNATTKAKGATQRALCLHNKAQLKTYGYMDDYGIFSRKDLNWMIEAELKCWGCHGAVTANKLYWRDKP